jgi:FAD/FMN-containing dehydrogenase
LARPAVAVVAPSDTGEVAATIRACAATRTPVIPFGGGTGLVGGQLAEDGAPPVILSLERMRAVRALDAVAGTMTVEAGAILSDIHAAAEAEGLIFPLTLASQGSARIGGLLSTNAGGVNVIRYGNARDLCLGIEAVLPDGSVMHTLSGLRKNNMGYDLRHLMIGAEGTLGVITAATLRLFPKPATTGAALMVVPDPDAALGLLRLAQARVGAGLSAFEIMHRMGLDFLREVGPEVRHPFASPPEWMCLIDLGMGAGDDPRGAGDALCRGVRGGVRHRRPRGPVRGAAGRVLDPARDHPARQPADRGDLVARHLRPRGRDPGLHRESAGRLAEIGDYRINCFGHLGDGNLHYNVFPLPGRSARTTMRSGPRSSACVHDLVHEMGGSVSAEHGIGRLKVDDLERYGDPAKLAAMRAIKAALDPLGDHEPGGRVAGVTARRRASGCPLSRHWSERQWTTPSRRAGALAAGCAGRAEQ